MQEFLGSLIHTFILFIYVATQFLILLVEMRYLINWFLNVNPFSEPVATLWAWTNPIFTFGRAWYPRIFGVDVTPLINYKILTAFGRFTQDLLGFSFDLPTSESDDLEETMTEDATIEMDDDYDYDRIMHSLNFDNGESIFANSLSLSNHDHSIDLISPFFHFSELFLDEFHKLVF